MTDSYQTAAGHGRHADYVYPVHVGAPERELRIAVCVEEHGLFTGKNASLDLNGLLIPVLDRVVEIALKFDEVVTRTSEGSYPAALRFNENDGPIVKNEEVLFEAAIFKIVVAVDSGFRKDFLDLGKIVF